jgi:hypothetical protein
VDEYGLEDNRPDDYAAMLAELEQKLDRRKLRAALGVGKRELDEIRVGHVPSKEAAQRLRLLYDFGRKMDLNDRRALAAALLESRGDVPATHLTLFRRPWLVLALFLAFDAVVVAVGLGYYLLAGG